MKHSAEYERFTALVDRVLAVPDDVTKQRVEDHRKLAAQKPQRRGPKPKNKITPSASGLAAKS